MIDANELRKGTTFFLDDVLYQVLEYQHYKPGRGNAIIRTKIRNMRTGAIVPRNFLNGQRFEEAPVERLTAQYLYNDGENFYFMNTETYDQILMRSTLVDDRAGYLKDGMEVTLTVHETEILDLELPMNVELEVIETEMAIAGDTASGTSKTVVCETGLQVQVPLFIKVGDIIRIDTRGSGYVTRV